MKGNVTYFDCPYCHARQTWQDPREGTFDFQCRDCRKYFQGITQLGISIIEKRLFVTPDVSNNEHELILL